MGGIPPSHITICTSKPGDDLWRTRLIDPCCFSNRTPLLPGGLLREGLLDGGRRRPGCLIHQEPQVQVQGRRHLLRGHPQGHRGCRQRYRGRCQRFAAYKGGEGRQDGGRSGGYAFAWEAKAGGKAVKALTRLIKLFAFDLVCLVAATRVPR